LIAVYYIKIFINQVYAERRGIEHELEPFIGIAHYICSFLHVGYVFKLL
jgi:hypothetical protein